MGVRAPQIDFAPRPASQRLLAPFVVLLAIAFSGAILWQYLRAARELTRIEERIDAATAAAERRRTARPVEAPPAIAPARIHAINAAIARLNVPWGDLFAAFEAQRPKDVGLLALLPDARKRSLVVQAEAVTPRAMIEFVDQLRSVELFEDAYLLKHERREQESGQPYRFAVEVRWKELP
jgi:hypothetical protein